PRSSHELRVGVGESLPTSRQRAWAGATLPPRPATREAAPPLPRHPGGGTAGKLRVGAFAVGGGYAAQRHSRRTAGREIDKRVDMRPFRRTRGAATVACDVVPNRAPTPADPLTSQALILPPGAAPSPELRAWAGESLPPRPSTREPAPPLPRLPGGGTAGEQRVGAFAGWFPYAYTYAYACPCPANTPFPSP